MNLCVFSMRKQVPFVEEVGAKRILMGVGRVLHVSPCVEYEYNTKDLNGKLRSVFWERMIQHSIRPDLKDGFLLPYHAAIEIAASDQDFDLQGLLLPSHRTTGSLNFRTHPSL